MNQAFLVTRREFIGSTLAATAAGGLIGDIGSHAAEEKPAAPAPATEFKRKIKLGVVGLGGRGHWIAELFRKHGGYEIHAVADYFPNVADDRGNALGVDKARRFSGLSGYKKVIESGAEAIVIIDVPYFYPEQAKAAVEAGLHVYMAKPVAVDVPGALSIGESGKVATQKQRVFLVDYQMPTDPFNQGVVQRIHDGGLGKIAYMTTLGYSAGRPDPPKTATIENRLQNLIWINDVVLGCDYIGNVDIHAIDAALWVANARPVSAAGVSRICRADPHGNARDVCQVVFEFTDGLVLNHSGQALKNNAEGALTCRIFGMQAYAQIDYWGKAFLRGGPKHYAGGAIQNLYQDGAQRNIATFYNTLTKGDFSNPTVRRSVDSCLTCILGREAAARHSKLTMEELLKENVRLEVDLKGLKV